RHSVLGTTSRGLFAEPSASFRRDPQISSSSRRRAREAERRQVTVLVCGCDVFESDTYLDSLGAEDQSDVVKAFQRACELGVCQFDGALVQCNEQGLLACFGYPIAHEDAARRAVQSGLATLERTHLLGQRLRHDHELKLDLRIGIHTGLAIV